MNAILHLPNHFANPAIFSQPIIKFAACNVGIDDPQKVYNDYFALIAADTEVETQEQRKRKIELACKIHHTEYFDKNTNMLKYNVIDGQFHSKHRYSAWNCQDLPIPVFNNQNIKDGDVLNIVDLYNQPIKDYDPYSEAIIFDAGYDIRPADLVVAGMINGAGRNNTMGGAHQEHQPNNGILCFNYVKLYRLFTVKKESDGGIYFNGHYLNNNNQDCLSPYLPIGHLLGTVAEIIPAN